MNVYFDMDGTIADLYGVENWLDHINNEDVLPYAVARPMVNMSYLARLLNKAQAVGHKIYVVSWLAPGSDDYSERTADAKRKWLSIHLKSVSFDGIEILPYGTPKNEGRSGILFDDEKRNREPWGENAYEPSEIFNVLKGLLK